jgi:hypothetical protein
VRASADTNLSIAHSVMNRPRLASALKTEPQHLTDGDPFRGGNPVPEATPHWVDSSGNTWSLIVTGCLSAALIASLACRLPAAHTLSWATIFLSSIKYIVLTAAGGAIGTSIPWFFLKEKPSFSLAFLSKTVAVGWIFLPCIFLFYRRQSPLMFLALALATIAVTFSLRRLFPARAVPEEEKLPIWHNTDLPSLYGFPIEEFRPVRAFVLAICGQAAFILAIADRPLLAGIFLSLCLSLLVWRWTAFIGSAIKQFAGRKQSILLSVFALCFTVLALLPWVAGKSRGSKETPRKPALITHEARESDVPGSDYVGIILWPPPIKKTEIVPPRPHSTSFAIGKARQPVVIPFDGQYWYFKAPSKRPGPRAHVAHGKATYVNVRSTDSAPLLMEAYQNLGTSIDLGCCSEIDVAITNADVRSGTLALGIRLGDSDSIGEPSQDLGERTIVSSKAAQIPLSRPPVEEVLRFPITQPTTIRRFDEITIVFLSAKERARGGAKVSIQSFTLIPR